MPDDAIVRVKVRFGGKADGVVDLDHEGRGLVDEDAILIVREVGDQINGGLRFRLVRHRLVGGIGG